MLISEHCCNSECNLVKTKNKNETLCLFVVNKRSSATAKSTARHIVLSWCTCTLWHFSGENLLMANQPLLRILATKATEFGEITQNNGHYAVQRSALWAMRTCYKNDCTSRNDLVLFCSDQNRRRWEVWESLRLLSLGFFSVKWFLDKPVCSSGLLMRAATGLAEGGRFVGFSECIGLHNPQSPLATAWCKRHLSGTVTATRYANVCWQKLQ